MISWLNFITLLSSSVMFTVYYLISVRPASLERKIGSTAYEKCKWYRIVSGTFMTIAGFNYIGFGYYPIPGLSPNLLSFPWSYAISIRIALAVAVPFGYLMCIGMWNAGEETMTPKKQHKLYSGGIYEHMRHPQAVGEFVMWYTLALLEHSPFLMLFTTAVYLPIWYCFCIEEEKDLILRYGQAYEDYRQRVGWFPRVQLRLNLLRHGGKLTDE